MYAAALFGAGQKEKKAAWLGAGNNQLLGILLLMHEGTL
jgi:hypothetical protein